VFEPVNCVFTDSARKMLGSYCIDPVTEITCVSLGKAYLSEEKAEAEAKAIQEAVVNVRTPEEYIKILIERFNHKWQMHGMRKKTAIIWSFAKTNRPQG